MKATNRRRIVTGITLLALMILSVSCYVWAMGLSKSALAPSERVCNNLLEAGYLGDEEQCVISKHPPTYIEGMIPLGVDKNYVRAAMIGFTLEIDTENICWNRVKGDTCAELLYQIQGNPQNPLSAKEYYSFGFRNDVLTSMQWEN